MKRPELYAEPGEKAVPQRTEFLSKTTALITVLSGATSLTMVSAFVLTKFAHSQPILWAALPIFLLAGILPFLIRAIPKSINQRHIETTLTIWRCGVEELPILYHLRWLGPTICFALIAMGIWTMSICLHWTYLLIAEAPLKEFVLIPEFQMRVPAMVLIEGPLLFLASIFTAAALTAECWLTYKWQLETRSTDENRALIALDRLTSHALWRSNMSQAQKYSKQLLQLADSAKFNS